MARESPKLHLKTLLRDSDNAKSLAVSESSAKSHKKTMAMMADKHECYQLAVQDARTEVRNLVNIFSELSLATCAMQRIAPTILLEDFCGTALLCREWVTKFPLRKAYGIDLDADVLEYSRKKLADNSLVDSVHLIHGDVLCSKLGTRPPPHIIVAFNYGICYFHRFAILVEYFKRCKNILAPGGLFICDLFNAVAAEGSGNLGYRKNCGAFDYIFEQSNIDLISNTCYCHISFKFKDGSWMKRAFSYHFRMWTLAEVRDAMLEAGFVKVDFFLSYDDGESGSDEKTYVHMSQKITGVNRSWSAYITGI